MACVYVCVCKALNQRVRALKKTVGQWTHRWHGPTQNHLLSGRASHHDMTCHDYRRWKSPHLIASHVLPSGRSQVSVLSCLLTSFCITQTCFKAPCTNNAVTFGTPWSITAWSVKSGPRQVKKRKLLPARLLPSQFAHSDKPTPCIRHNSFTEHWVLVATDSWHVTSAKAGSRHDKKYGRATSMYAGITPVSVKSGSRLAARYGDSIRRYARITAVSVKCDYWHTTSRHARITTPLVKSGSRLGEVWGWEDMLESQQSRSNLDRNWLRGMGTVSEGMLESPQSRSNLDQNWLGSIGILPAGMLESQLSWSSLVQDRLGSIGILPAGMLESQQSQSHLAGKYWHTTSRYAI